MTEQGIVATSASSRLIESRQLGQAIYDLRNLTSTTGTTLCEALRDGRRVRRHVVDGSEEVTICLRAQVVAKVPQIERCEDGRPSKPFQHSIHACAGIVGCVNTWEQQASAS